MSRPVVDVIELEAWSLRKAGPELIFGRCRHHVDPEGLMYSYEQRLVDLGVTAEELDRNDVWTTLVGPKHDIHAGVLSNVETPHTEKHGIVVI